MSNRAFREPRRATPTSEQLEAARNQVLRDVIAADLHAVFVGINPSLYSTATGHHFARPGNRFWPSLHAGGWTDRLLSPEEDESLLDYDCGLTNMVERTTAKASELSAEDYKQGRAKLERLIERYKPRKLVVLGITSFAKAFDCRDTKVGRRPDSIGGASVWILPNPSGLNAHYQLPDFAKLFRMVRESD